MMLFLNSSYSKKKEYMNTDIIYLTTMKNIDKIYLNTESNRIIVNEIEIKKFFPVNPFLKTKRQNILFLNSYFFESYHCYIDAWHEACNCDALSIYEKMDYIIKYKHPLVIDEKTLEFMKKYFKIKYNKSLIFTKAAPFDKELSLYNLYYE
jgi:hypothetical protein